MAAHSPSSDRTAPTSFEIALDALLRDYHVTGHTAELHARLATLMDTGTPDALMLAAERYRDILEIAGPLYERVVERDPTNVRAIIGLANAYWLTGHGPEAVGALADRAKAADPHSRAAWHLWALTESNPRRRVDRWRRVCDEFSDDDLARANLADNAASLAGAEDDPAALQLALETYADLRSRAKEPAQVAALDQALVTLRQWKV
jgi:hypothetical protein